MRITAVRWRSVHNRLKVPFVTSLRRVEALESLELLLETDIGLTGVGGAAPTRAITGETLRTLQTAFSGPVNRIFTGADPDDHLSIMKVLERQLPKQTSARAAVSIALHDLLAQKQSSPLYALLGPDRSCPPTSYTISLDTPEEMVRQTIFAVRSGFSLLKIKLGSSDGDDGRRMAAIVRNAGPDVRFRLDPNQGWSLEESLRYMELFRKNGYPVDFVEQPLRADDISGLATLCKSKLFPIVADESVFSPDDAKHVITAGAADIINIKLMKTGGLAAAMDICRLAESAGLDVMVGCMLEGAASIKAAIHLAFSRFVVRYTDLDAPLLFSEMPDELASVYQGDRIILE